MPRRSLSDARLYLCVDARERQGDLSDFLDAVLENGVDIVQLRQKGIEARQELAALEVFAAACERHDALLAVNDRADVAWASGAPVLHLGQDDLPVSVARALVDDDVLIGRSSHSEAEAAAAAVEEGVDYFCVGPCWPTPTKPGTTRPRSRPRSLRERPRHRSAVVRHRRDRPREPRPGARRGRPPGGRRARDHRGCGSSRGGSSVCDPAFAGRASTLNTCRLAARPS